MTASKGAGPEIVLQTRGLVKTYRGNAVPSLAGVDLAIPAGALFGLLGPNGAGKTTMMKMIYGRSSRDAGDGGTVSVFGYDPACDELAIKYLSGVVPQENNLDDELDVVKNLVIYSKFYGLPGRVARARIEGLLEFLELSEKATSRIRELSGGMQRRLVIARALLNNPKLLILDEPTTGLDPQVRHVIWDKLRQLRAQGTTILLTTHYMEEAFQICDTVLIMDKGAQVLEDDPRDLLRENIEAYVLEVPMINGALPIQETGLPEGVRLDRAEGTLRFYAPEIDQLKSVVERLSGNQYYLRQSTLEDVFLKATGRALNEEQ
jgi:lipooligosaccharide transport system ATP-binding protein